LADEAEDHLLPPDIGKCSAALSGMPIREAYLLAIEYRDMSTKCEGEEIDEVSQETPASSDFCDTGFQASATHRC
jgi:hypothetical protein